MNTGKTIALTRWTFVGKVMFLLFNMLSRLVIAFLPRSKRLLISWLQSPSEVILEAKKIKSLIVSPSICHEVMGPDTVIFVFWMLSFKPTFSLSSFTYIKRLFGSSSLSSIRVLSFAYLRLLVFLLQSWFQLVLHIIVWNNKVQNGLIFRIAHMHTDILLGDVHRPGGDGEFGAQTSGIRRHTDGDDHPSSGAGVQRPPRQPEAPGEAIWGHWAAPWVTVPLPPWGQCLGVTGATPKALAVAGRCPPTHPLQHLHLRAPAQACSLPAEGASPPGNGSYSGNPQNSPNSLTWFIFAWTCTCWPQRQFSGIYTHIY